MDTEERDVRAIRLIQEWVLLRQSILSGETPEMGKIAVELMDLFPTATKDGQPTLVIQRLARERNEREARRRQLEMALDTIAYIDPMQVGVEHNPLYLGDNINDGYSYLEQAQINLPEVGPGEGDHVRNALVMLIDVANHRRRDAMGDSERIAIGWKEIER